MANPHERSTPPPGKIIPLNPYAHPGAWHGAHRIVRDIHSLTSTMAEAVDFYGQYDAMVADGLALIDTWEHYATHLEEMLRIA